MGHRRLGRLPKTYQWERVFSSLDSPGINPAQIAQAVSFATRKEFELLKGDEGVNYPFWVLVRVITASNSDDFEQELERLGFEKKEISSGAEFIKCLSQIVEREVAEREGSPLYGKIAELSLRETLSKYILEESRSLFGTSLVEIQTACKKISSKKSFGLVARDFFSTFILKSIKYITDKESSNYVGPDKTFSSPSHLLKFQDHLERYCYEISLIVQEYSSGWYSRHNWISKKDISEQEALGFTAFVLEKIQMELLEGRK